MPVISIIIYAFLMNVLNFNFDLTTLKIIFNLLANVLVLYIIIKLNKIDIKKEFISFKENKIKFTLTALILWLIGFVLMIIANSILNNYFPLPSNEMIIRNEFQTNFINSIISVVIFSPIFEEILFRYNFRIIKNKYLYLVITTLLFSLVHISSISEIPYLISYIFLGLSFSLCYLKTKNLYPSIIAHVFHNLLGVLSLFIF